MAKKEAKEAREVFDNKWAVSYLSDAGTDYLNDLVEMFLKYMRGQGTVYNLDVEAWWVDMVDMYNTLCTNAIINVTVSEFLREPVSPHRKTFVISITNSKDRSILNAYEPVSWIIN